MQQKLILVITLLGWCVGNSAKHSSATCRLLCWCPRCRRTHRQSTTEWAHRWGSSACLRWEFHCRTTAWQVCASAGH